MRVIETALVGPLILEPRVYEDDRGYFLESWHEERYRLLGIEEPFVQDNLSSSRHGVLRGLHFQNPTVQGKLVSVLQGAVFDVVVDLRAGSATFGRWVGVTLSSENRRQLWIPPGFAHGFQATSDSAVFHYKCTAYYAAAHERSIRWDDPDLDIAWPVADPVLSPKDARAPLLGEIPPDHLFPPTAGAASQGR